MVLITLVRGLFPLEKVPGVISLLAGKPNASTFPFTSLSFNARSPNNDGAERVINLNETDLAQGLQYGDTAGLKDLLEWIFRLQELNHGRQKDEGWRVSIGSGSQDLIFKVGLSSIVVLSTLTRVCYAGRQWPLWSILETRCSLSHLYMRTHHSTNLFHDGVAI
jgi:hypothetical protein